MKLHKSLESVWNCAKSKSARRCYYFVIEISHLWRILSGSVGSYCIYFCFVCMISVCQVFGPLGLLVLLIAASSASPQVKSSQILQTSGSGEDFLHLELNEANQKLTAYSSKREIEFSLINNQIISESAITKEWVKINRREVCYSKMCSRNPSKPPLSTLQSTDQITYQASQKPDRLPPSVPPTKWISHQTYHP